MGRSGSYLNNSITSAWSEHSLDPEDIRVSRVVIRRRGVDQASFRRHSPQYLTNQSSVVLALGISNGSRAELSDSLMQPRIQSFGCSWR